MDIIILVGIEKNGETMKKHVNDVLENILQLDAKECYENRDQFIMQKYEEHKFSSIGMLETAKSVAKTEFADFFDVYLCQGVAYFRAASIYRNELLMSAMHDIYMDNKKVDSRLNESVESPSFNPFGMFGGGKK